MDILQVRLPQAGGHLYLMDLSGRQVLQRYVENTLEELSLSSLPAGAYLLLFDDGQKRESMGKVVKLRK